MNDARKDLPPGEASLWDRLQTARGEKYWRTLEELAGGEAFGERLRQEFPAQATEWPDRLSRRRFLTLMGASLSLAGLAGCSVRPAPTSLIVPRVRAPEEYIPGKPLFFATAMTLGGSGVGLLVESHEGRPTKVEGNPDHPASLGATGTHHQASVLTLYDPDRSGTVTHLGRTTTWTAALAALRAALARARKRRGEGLRLLTESIVSPTLGEQLEALLERHPEARWHQYEPLARDSAHHAARLAFGEPINTYPDLRKADVILSLDSDFLARGPGHLRHVADFAARRRVRTSAAAAKRARMNRLYMVETTLSLTGAKADHRLAVRPRQVEAIARAIAARLGVGPGGGDAPADEAWIDAVVKDLQAHRGRCVVLAGDRQPPAVHLLAHAINQHLGAFGQTVLHTDPVPTRPADHAGSLRELADDMEAGRVETLLILGGNPVYTAPADLHFGERMGKVAQRFHLSLYHDETSHLCHWHLPEAHYLESWGDTRAFEGTASIVQPLIEPLYQGRSAIEVLTALAGLEKPGRELVRDHWRRWRGRNGSTDGFEDFWETALHDGVIPGTHLPTRTLSLQGGWEKHLGPAPTPAEEGTFELSFQPDPTLYDGRFANNGWLQELPKPITRITWGNVAVVSPETARALNVSLGDYAHGGEHGGFYQSMVELRLDGRTVTAPVWIMPGHADGAVTVWLGNGRTHAGRVAQGVGFDAYRLRTSGQPWFAPGLQMAVRRDLPTQLVACVQEHHLMENRDVVRSATLTEYQKDPRAVSEKERDRRLEPLGKGRIPLTLYEPFEYPRRRWGMSIDLTTCVGCAACVVACQAENNIPVVGKEQVAAGREMHWIRIDHYAAGPLAAPTEHHFQPVPCMQCEHAPCEYVCPTEATVHSDEGLNDMIYQRCVGTRFCSNNCPYKVRRFNFLLYGDFETPSLKLLHNPDVTVRSRGVMEKCTYCVQRIRAAEIEAGKESRPIADGEILTACQAACPAKAIVFGDIADRNSEVRRWKESPLDYALLAELNTQPRTTYLAALRNPNPDLEG
jgi:MoCo/4Fe-4S cofactor protein with predicted Tat translocation signal